MAGKTSKIISTDMRVKNNATIWLNSMMSVCFIYRSLKTVIGENAFRNGMVYGTSTFDEYSQSRNHYSRIPSHNALQTEM